MADRDLSIRFTADGMTQVKSAADMVERSLTGITSAASKITSAFLQFTGLSSVIAGIGSAAGLGSVVKSALEASDKMANLKLGFQTMLGTKNAADGFVNTLQNIANVTPYNVEPLAEASRVMLAMNFNARQTEQIIWRLGDAAAAAGKGFDFIKDIAYVMGQIKASGVLRTEDFNQIANSGLMGYEQMAKTLGYKTTAEFRKAMENGLIPSNAAINALVGTFDVKFKGTMGNIAQTLGGRLSTLADTWSSALRQIGDALTPGVNKIIIGITGAVQGLVDSGWFTKVATAFSSMIDPDKIMQAIAKGMAVVKTVFDNAPTAFNGVIEVMKALPGALMAVFEAAQKKDFWGAIMGTIVEGVERAGAWILKELSYGLVSVFTAIFRPVAKMIDKLPFAHGTLKEFDKNSDASKRVVYNFFQGAEDYYKEFGANHRNVGLAELNKDDRFKALQSAGGNLLGTVQKGISEYSSNFADIYNSMKSANANPNPVTKAPDFTPLSVDTSDIVRNTAKTADNTGRTADGLKRYVMGGGDIGEAGVTPYNMYRDGIDRGSTYSGAAAFVETVVLQVMKRQRYARN